MKYTNVPRSLAVGRLFTWSAAILVLLIHAAASAQDWKDALKVEQAQNAARIAAIDTEAKPVYNRLKEVGAQIDRHNANQCVATSDNPGACAGYNAEAQRLNNSKDELLARLRSLASESDRLIARNKEIERRLKLACVPFTTQCRSNADCNECSTCGAFDPISGKGYCQPVH